jgi:hypothetical protein
MMTGAAQTGVENFAPHHMQRAKHLLLDDHANRVGFQPQILPDILFMDEARFPWDGIKNTRNSHTWAQENSHQLTTCHFQSVFQFIYGVEY